MMKCLKFNGIRVATLLMFGVFCLSVANGSVAASDQKTIQIASADKRAPSTKQGKAKVGNNGSLLCPEYQWLAKDGYCYKCPHGYLHDMAQPTDSPKVCYKK